MTMESAQGSKLNTYSAIEANWMGIRVPETARNRFPLENPEFPQKKCFIALSDNRNVKPAL